ncbi:DUF4123 domain-containing protein [Jannaschia aquimarina]|uniref:DUF4123 domain-containing protein n=1 Tax=Jannaschia aquimarina TaxID=935700 RepID=A0A0D1CK97_9RHOB|nr:DUF4123 domain-containing protein [Jannaschia aquimarina]KIT15172.1 hypothetical protein jaqu_31170 [Jannaschia aquimarina]SNT43288.1 protein of unknown function [Jannaschia aquimarina]
MTHTTGDGGYWTNLLGPSAQDGAPTSALTVETIKGVEPLNDQFGVAAPLTVPPALRKALFGQPAPNEGSAPSPPLHTYAVLDAARVQGLPEMLETSGLDHACLFQGEAAEDYRDVAPYLVHLEEGQQLTRQLFIQGDAPWEMWDAEPGVFLRSTAPLDALKKHLRKFTKVQDQDGRWVYFRFWEGGGLLSLLRVWATRRQKLASFTARSKPDGIRGIVVLDRTGTATVVRLMENDHEQTVNAPFQLDADDRRALSSWRDARFDRRLLAELTTAYPALDAAQADETGDWLRSVIDAAEDAGIRLEPAIVNFAHAAYLLRADPCTHGETVHLLRDRTLHQKDRARLARAAAERRSKLRG